MAPKPKESEPKKVAVRQTKEIATKPIDQISPMHLVEMAINKDLDIEKLEKIMAMQVAMEDRQARKNFFLALSNFQSEIPVITKRGSASFDHRNGGGKTEYSFGKLEDITEAIKPHLIPNGLSYRWEQKSYENGALDVTCIFTHMDGHSESTSMSAYPDESGKKNKIQQSASTISYLKRYTLTSAGGITVGDEDLDGHEEESSQDNSQEADIDQDQTFCDVEKFNSSFPAWEKQILGGKLPERVIQFLESKGTFLSPDQKTKLHQIGK